jgi:hypothetical protein
MHGLQRLACTSSLIVLCAIPTQAATIFDFPNFNNCAGLQVNGSAACTGGVLRVTPANFNQAGSAFSTTLIPLGPGASFSTFFSFRISASGNGGADGIVFVIQPVSASLGALGGGMGYEGIPSSLGVEFDTWDNGIGAGDPNGSHAGIDLNGSVNSVQTADIAPPIDDGNIWNAWIDYDGAVLELRLSQGATRPSAPTMSRPVNLDGILGATQAFVGFTSGTGAAFADHDILTWQFNNAFEPIGVVQLVPVPTLSAVAVLLLACLAAGIGMRAIRSQRT